MNELELLEVRLIELYPVVDRFVICESSRTFSNNKKELVYHNNMVKFKPYHDKIIHVIADNCPFTNAWANESHQRNQLLRGLSLDRSDVVMISDVDEIPNRNAVKQISAHIMPYTFSMRGYYGYINNAIIKPESQKFMTSTVVVDGESARVRGAQYWREQRGHLPQVIGGWHFSYMGGAERIKTKLESYAHTEYNREDLKDLARLRSAILSARDPLSRSDFKLEIEKIDDSYPEVIKQGQFSHLLNPSL